MEKKEEERKTFSDTVKDSINYQKKVTIKFPENVFNKLNKLAKSDSNDCFWLMISLALDKYEEYKVKNPEIIMLMLRDDELKNKIDGLDKRVNELEKPKPISKVIRSFGKKEEKKDE